MSIWENLTTTLVGFSSHIISGIKTAASFIFARVMAWAGLTYVNMKWVMPDIKSFVQDYATALPPKVIDLAGAMGVDVFMVLILSAIVAKVGVRAFLAGVDELQNLISNAGG